MQSWRKLLPVDFPPLAILQEANVLVRSRGLRDQQGRRLPGGLFRSDGSEIDPGKDLGGPAPTNAPAAPVSHPVRFREGTWVYGGVLLNHFGHVLIETGARLWAVAELRKRGVAVDGVIFQPKKMTAGQENVAFPAASGAFLSVFAQGVNVVCAGMPEIVERLFVPEIAISVSPDRFIGTPAHWDLFRDCAARIPREVERSDLYISRSAGGARGGFLFEADLEAALSAQGYRIYHPQHHSIRDQIATYRAARRVVTIDGSALHLAAAALPSDAIVAVLARREFYAWAMADQLRAAAGCVATVVDARGPVYNIGGPAASQVDLTTPKGWSSSFVLPDLAKLGQDLVDAGVLDRLPEWPSRSAADLEQELQRAARLVGQPLVPVSDKLLQLQPYFGQRPRHSAT